ENCGPSGGPTGTKDAPPLSGDAHVEAVPTATGQPCPEPGPEQAQPQECLEENYGPSGGPTGIEDAPPLPGDAPVETVPPATRQPYPEPGPEQAQPRECLEENCGPSGGPTGTEEAPPLHDDALVGMVPPATGQPCPAGRMPRNPEEEPIHEEPTGKAANGGEMGGATEIGVDGVPWIVKNFCYQIALSFGGTSVLTVLHTIQFFKTGKFQRYNYGIEENLKRYKQSFPPPYDLHRISTPTALYYSDIDVFAPAEDVEKLIENFSGPTYRCLMKGLTHIAEASDPRFRFYLKNLVEVADSMTGRSSSSR
ncbi:hypothetical protein GE061_017762, partial [Apolygus lucorum]